MKNITIRPLEAGRLVIKAQSSGEAAAVMKSIQDAGINGMAVSLTDDTSIIAEYDEVMLRFLPIEPAKGDENEEYRKIKRVLEDII